MNEWIVTDNDEEFYKRNNVPELIRCKDCKFFKPQFNEDGHYTTNCQFSKVAEVNGFCHMARRKEE